MKKIGQDYVDYMEKKIIHFERIAQDLFDRSIKQTLLIHASLLNADYLDELAQMYQRHGYRFISQSEVLLDEAYQTEIAPRGYGSWGISWLDRWALSQGKKGEFFSGDPPTPEYVVELAK